MSSSGTIPSLEGTFRESDLDNDGYIDHDELKYAFKKLGKVVSDDALQELMQHHSSSGKVDFEDFVRIAQLLVSSAPDGSDEASMRWVFSMFDTDGDGEVNIDELRRLLHDINGDQGSIDVETLVQQLDQEGRGHVDFPHFFRAVQKLLGKEEVTQNRNTRSHSWLAPDAIAAFRKRGEVHEHEADGDPDFGAQRKMIEDYKFMIEKLKSENETLLSKCNLIQSELLFVRDANEKYEQDIVQLNETIALGKKAMRHNQALIAQTKVMENNNESLQGEVVRMKDHYKELKGSYTKLKQEKDVLADDLVGKKRELRFAEDRYNDLTTSLTAASPIRKSMSLSNFSMSDIEKMQDENVALRASLEREQKKIVHLTQLLTEDKSQLQEDSALLESSNQTIKKLREALEEQQHSVISPFGNNDSTLYKQSLLSELEQEVAVRLTPRVMELDEEIKRALPRNTKLDLLSPMHGSPSPRMPDPNGQSINDLSSIKSPVAGDSQTDTSQQIELLDEIEELEEQLADEREKSMRLERVCSELREENLVLKESATPRAANNNVDTPYREPQQAQLEHASKPLSSSSPIPKLSFKSVPSTPVSLMAQAASPKGLPKAPSQGTTPTASEEQQQPPQEDPILAVVHVLERSKAAKDRLQEIRARSKNNVPQTSLESNEIGDQLSSVELLQDAIAKFLESEISGTKVQPKAQPSKEREEMTAEIRRLHEQLEKVNSRIQTYDANEKALQGQMAGLQEALARITRENNQLRERAPMLEKHISEKELALQTANKKHQEEYRSLTQKMRGISEQMEKQVSDVSRARDMERAAYQQKLDDTNEDLRKYQKEVEGLRALLIAAKNSSTARQDGDVSMKQFGDTQDSYQHPYSEKAALLNEEQESLKPNSGCCCILM